jgi:hypothetical protein
MQFGVIYLKTRGSTQPYVALSTLEFCSCFFVFGGAHTAPNSRTSYKPLSIAFGLVCLDGSWMGLPFLVFRSKRLMEKGPD